MRWPREGRLVLFLSLAVAAASSGSYAQQLGPEFRLNESTSWKQWNPDVASTPAGDFVAVWTSDQEFEPDVYGRRFDRRGTPLGGEFRVNTFTILPQGAPAVAVGSNGEFVVVWSSRYQDGDFLGVFGQRYDADGLPVGEEFLVPTTTTGDQTRPDVAIEPGGGFVVVWEHDIASVEAEVRARRFDAGGIPLGPEFQVNSYTTEVQAYAAIAMSASGHFLIVWDSYGQDGDSWGLFGRRFDPQGNPLGPEFQVNSYTTRGQVAPAVALDETGRAVVIWQSDLQDGPNGFGVYGQLYGADGEPFGEELRVNTYTPRYQGSAAVAYDADGGFVVAWRSYPGQDGDNGGVFAQQFDASGVRVGEELQVNAFTSGDQETSSITAAGPGHFIVAWTSWDDQDGSFAGAYARRLHAAALLEGSESGILCGWNAAVVEVDEIALPACPPPP